MSDKNKNISFVPVPFIFCPLPVRDPKENEWSRETGNSSMFLTSSKGIPFGKWGRISLTLLITEALRTGNKELAIGRVGEVLKSVGQSVTGGKSGSITRITNQMNRIGHTYMSFDSNLSDGNIQGIKSINVGIADELELYWSNSQVGEHELQNFLFENRILLSDRFYELIEKHSTPIDLDCYASMNPLEQDVYSWLVRRMYTLRKPTLVKWDHLYTQFGENITPTAKPRFRERFKKALYDVTQKSYHDAKIQVENEGIRLYPSPLSIKNEGRLIT
jgi:hypothetical protein